MILDLPPNIEQLVLEQAKKQGVTAQTWLIDAIQTKAQPSYANGDFDFDLERMKEAIGETDENGRAKNTIAIPKGLAKDKKAFREWVKANAR